MSLLKRNALYTASINRSWNNHYGNQYRGFSKKKKKKPTLQLELLVIELPYSKHTARRTSRHSTVLCTSGFAYITVHSRQATDE